MVFVTFFGKERIGLSMKPGARMLLPLGALGLLSIVGGFVELPETLGNLPLFSDFMSGTFPAASEHAAENELLLQILASLVSVSGIVLAYVLYIRRPVFAEKFAILRPIEALRKFCFAGWGFDALYDALFVRPFAWIAKVNKDDFIDSGYDGIVTMNAALHRVLSKTQTGSIRWYAMGIAVGVVVFLGIVFLLS
jgi:NADH-quinone oxidoreductase subunit L